MSRARPRRYSRRYALAILAHARDKPGCVFPASTRTSLLVLVKRTGRPGCGVRSLGPSPCARFVCWQIVAYSARGFHHGRLLRTAVV
jgi:hypothetical protein